jgi:hypothetical protein
MLMIVWNPLESHILDALPNGRISDAEYYHDNTLTALVSLRLEGAGRTWYSCRQCSGPYGQKMLGLLY